MDAGTRHGREEQPPERKCSPALPSRLRRTRVERATVRFRVRRELCRKVPNAMNAPEYAKTCAKPDVGHSLRHRDHYAVSRMCRLIDGLAIPAKFERLAAGEYLDGAWHDLKMDPTA